MGRRCGHWAITGLSVASRPSRSAEPCQPGVTGYGPSSRRDVAALLREISATIRAARSVHTSGTIQQGGKTLGMNFGITRSGEVSGQLSVSGAASQEPVVVEICVKRRMGGGSLCVIAVHTDRF